MVWSNRRRYSCPDGCGNGSSDGLAGGGCSRASLMVSVVWAVRAEREVLEKLQDVGVVQDGLVEGGSRRLGPGWDGLYLLQI